MEINELMVGDYVHSLRHNVDTKIDAIEKYFKDGETDSVWLEDKSCWDKHYMDEIAPIPLTVEIMQRYFPEPEYVAWSNMRDIDNGLFFHISIAYHGLQVVFPHVRYVHELQNILNICGIDIKIEL